MFFILKLFWNKDEDSHSQFILASLNKVSYSSAQIIFQINGSNKYLLTLIKVIKMS